TRSRHCPPRLLSKHDGTVLQAPTASRTGGDSRLRRYRVVAVHLDLSRNDERWWQGDHNQRARNAGLSQRRWRLANRPRSLFWYAGNRRSEGLLVFWRKISDFTQTRRGNGLESERIVTTVWMFALISIPQPLTQAPAPSFRRSCSLNLPPAYFVNA